MSLSAADLSRLSRLYDQAVELDEAALDAWLAALPEAERHLVPALQRMLARHGPDRTVGFLSALPSMLDDATARDESMATPGDVVGPYRLLHEIGRGGMGTVWLAERADGAFKRQVALKLPRLAWGAGLGVRMARESEIGAMLEHPHIARLYDAGVDDKGRPYIALEHIEGQPIDAWCRDQGLGVRQKLQLVVQVARAVAYAHGRLVVHRDLKPSNVLVSADGQVHLLDFGIAKLLQDEGEAGQTGLTQEHGRLLTPHYASPEQIAGRPVTVQSDVYSLGVLAYELLTGRMPYEPTRKTLGALEEEILQGEPAPPSARVHDKALARQLKGDIDAIVGKALKREPIERYASAEALAEDLQRSLGHQPVVARPDRAWYRLRKNARRHWIGVSASAAVAVAVVAGTAMATLQSQRADRAAQKTRLMTSFVAAVFQSNNASGAIKYGNEGLVGDAFLRTSASLVEARFSDEPELQASMYGELARVFLELGAGDQAVVYAAKQLNSLTAIGANRRQLFDATLILAMALKDDQRYPDAEAKARKALELAGEDVQRQADSLSVLAQALTWSGKNKDADDVLKRLKGATDKLGRPSLAEAWGYAMAGSLLTSAGRYEESGGWFQKGIDMALKLHGESSMDVAFMRLHRAAQMLFGEKPEDTRRMLELAFDGYRRRGGFGAVRADLVAPPYYAQLFGVRGSSYADTRQVFEAAHSTMSRVPAVPDKRRAAIAEAETSLLASWGDLEQARPNLVRNADEAMRHMHSPHMKHFVVMRTVNALMRRGEHTLTDAWLRESIRLRTEMGERESPNAMGTLGLIARNLAMSGKHNAALAVLDGEGDYDLKPARLTARLDSYVQMIRALVLVDAGRFDEASEKIARLTLSIDDLDEEDLVLVGSLRCRQGKAVQGLSMLEQGERTYALDRYPHSPELAWARAHIGLCAILSGDRTKAMRYAKLAHASLAVQPNVSDYFKRPLLELDARLGVR